MKRKSFILFLFTAAVLMTACGGKKEKETATAQSYRDGVYTAEAEPEEVGGAISLTITVSEGKITEVQMKNTDRNGKEKDEDYGKTDGKITNPGLYKIAQQSVEATAKFPQLLIEAQTPDGVDAISGATLSYRACIKAANEALEQAKK